MEIPGFTTYSGQPTVTNPLTPANLVVGQKSQAQKTSETSNTELNRQQPATSLATNQVVNQTNDVDDTGLKSYAPGSYVDEKA